MKNHDRLLLVSGLGWLTFLLVGLLHAMPLFNITPVSGETINQIARLITRLGDPTTLVYATILVVLYLVVYERSLLLAGIASLNMLAGWLLMDILKAWWAIPRPVGEHLVLVSDYSYPSGHAMLSLVFYGFLAWYLATKGQHRGWSLLMILIALLVGLSRPLLNVHFPADVIGGWGAGLGWLTLMLWLYYQLTQRVEKKDD